ncbi:hypothetical protein [Thalassobaculum sp.]|uniref:hypothetical protein n=1 Tax=Thalassobaculum sp. TaxID=2022740 RepID=UPI0032EE0CFB
MNETLEAMARAIFKDWFVDFGPTRAKMEGRAPYLAPEIWALFPNRLDDEEKPEGWEYVALTEFSEEVRRGISPSYISDGGIRVLNQKCIRDRQVNFEPARRHDHGRRKVDDRLLRPGDILVNSTGVGTLGRVAQIWDLHEPTIVDSHVTIVRPNEGPENAYYVGVNLLNREQEIEALGEGSTGQTELSRTRLSTLSILRAGEDEQRAFAELIEPLVKKSLQNGRESETLTATRDLLLPKLMSGEIRVKDAEKLAEAAA